MTKRQQKGIWVIWTLTFPIFIYFFSINGIPVVQEHWGTILAFLCLILIASWFPIRFRHTNIVPLHGISLAVFLQFGLFVEAFVMQLAMMTSLMSLRLPKAEIYRYPLNSFIFLIVSISAASVYYLVGGTTGNFSEIALMDMVFPIIIYAFTYFFLNNWLIFIVRKYVVKLKNTRFFDEALAWEAMTAILIVPVGITLVLFYQEVGYLAIVLVGVPLVSVSLILKLYNESERTGKLLKQVSSFGFQVNEGLSVKKIIDLFFKTVASVFSVDYTYLYETEDKKLKLTQIYPAMETKHGTIDKVSNKVFQERQSLFFSNAKQWEYLQGECNIDNIQSIMSVPCIRDHEVVAVITLVSHRKRAFEKSHLKILEIMANYLAVAVQNARNYEQKQKESERCALTNLYNYRYFENLILEKYETPAMEDSFAIILLDLDHFKKINDTYGHHSGNEVLCQVASVLKETIDESGMVARYGGEEFVVLLEGSNVLYAEKIAEALRSEIESHLFTVSDDLKGRERKSIRITASIGVAVKSEPNETAMSVLRNADRAMYTGAKQQGRNRVSHF
ncbi:diguanylate cyclase (GGDEF)-like protein [Evansella vedderi]|uniref:Diguanylate cyclase (GGDEF)-like protein n=1 Tax=Evansella vedderi TaxID=38282 RepID=A0ABT9ZZ42_9BACI|nr:diguanylate cyclase [Evansella vedderi]MDQ0256507.1 diguanylate cyclase (GGDEF)-like protein [Evansella vedderi]